MTDSFYMINWTLAKIKKGAELNAVTEGLIVAAQI